MAETNWEEQYQKKDTPWNKEEPSPGLVDFLAGHPNLERGTVAVPGCGFGHDVEAWAKAGFNAFGFDLAPSAIKAGQERIKLPNAVVHQSNFLTDDPPFLFDWVFEHTLFCAINPTERDNYVKAARNWLRPNGQFVAVYYLIDDVDGPPFGTTKEEIVKRFSGTFEMLESWVPRSYPNRTGLEWMVWWRRK